MALTPVTVTFDIADLTGVDFDSRRTKVYATTNVPSGIVIDTVGNQIRLGSGTATVASDGTGTITVWAPGTGSNPDSWQTTIHIDYPDRNATGGRNTQSLGPFTITASANLADLVAEMPVQPEYAMQFLDRIDGLTDHGSVSGPVIIDPAKSTHWLDATGPTTLTISDGPTGGTRYVSILPITGAANVTMTEPADAELTDGAFATFAWVRGAWMLAGSGGSSGPADITPPSAVTDLTATGGEGQIVANWADQTDAESSVAYRYRAWLTSGGASGAWTTTATSTATITGLAAGAYTVEVYAYSGGGASATDTATATVTEPVVPFDDYVASLATGPTRWWPLDDAPGTTSPRQIGSNAAAITYALGGVTFGAASIGGTGTAASFAGGTGIVTNAGSGGTTYTELTMVAIVQPTSGGGIVGHASGSSGPGIVNSRLDMAGAAIDFPAWTGAAKMVVGRLKISDGATAVKFFINGVAFNSGTAAAGPVQAAWTDLVIGANPTYSAVLTGRMSDVMMFEGKALSDAEILGLAEAAGLA